MQLHLVCFVLIVLFDCLFHSDKTPAQLTLVQHPPAEIHLSHESRKTLSLGKHNINTPTQQNAA